jgi:hypothetical protein
MNTNGMELHVAENYYHLPGRRRATCSFHVFIFSVYMPATACPFSFPEKTAA